MKSVLLTGIRTGIGRNLLERFMADHWHVTGVIRRESQRRAFADFPQDRLKLFVADLSREDETFRLIEGIRALAFNVIVLNAGMTYSGHFLKLPREHIDEIIRTNLLANMHIVHGLIGRAVENNAKIVFISSLAARLPAFNSGVYAASKAGLSHFYTSLSYEYPALPMLCVEIGLVNTPFFEKSGAPAGPRNSFFKSPALIGGRLYREIQTKRGMTSLCADWTMMRKAFMIFEALTVWIISKLRSAYYSRQKILTKVL